MKFVFSLRLVTTICALTFIECGNAQNSAPNLALHKSYVLSAKPNYARTAPATDVSSLTDGVYTSGHFWTNKTTVGWRSVNPLKITIDLEKDQPIGAVTFNTAREISAEASYPANMFVFIGSDNQKFIFAGDMAASPDNKEGHYDVHKFTLKDINISGRYVLIVIQPRHPFIFCDEIEVLKGRADNRQATLKLTDKNNLGPLMDSVSKSEFYAGKLQESLNNRIGNPGAANKNELKTLQASLGSKNVTSETLNSITDKVRHDNAVNLKSKFSTDFIVEQQNPWDSFDPTYTPGSNPSKLDYNFFTPVGNVQFGSFILTNTTLSNQNYSFKITASAVSSIEIYKVPFVFTSDYRQVPDPLVPVKDTVSIASGGSQMFIFKVVGKANGAASSHIAVSSGGKSFNMNIYTTVSALFPSNSTSANYLNAVNWGYLTVGMLKDRKEAAVNDLYDHHINSIVVPAAVIPKIGGTDFSGLKDYLMYVKDAKYILLFNNFRSPTSKTPKKGVPFLSAAWKSAFIQWYKSILSCAQSAGFSPGQIYLYPYDEVRPDEIDDFKAFATWLKQGVPDAKLYATLGTKNAIDNLQTLMSIPQLPVKYKSSAADNPNSWFYVTKSFSRTLQPYSYYRLLAWTAFAGGAKGVGFWSYADIGKSNANLITGPAPVRDFAVVYDGPGTTLISSRRWEAFRLGMEDNRILNLYAQKFGADKAKSLARKVIESPDQTNLADEARNQMIKSLMK